MHAEEKQSRICVKLEVSIRKIFGAFLSVAMRCLSDHHRAKANSCVCILVRQLWFTSCCNACNEARHENLSIFCCCSDIKCKMTVSEVVLGC